MIGHPACRIGMEVCADWLRIEMSSPLFCLVAYNKAFYKSCLKAVFRDYQRFYLGYPFHCICAASRKVWPQVQQALNVTTACCGNDLSNRHQALADAEACVTIALENL